MKGDTRGERNTFTLLIIWLFEDESPLVMAGFIPAIYVFYMGWLPRRGWPGHRRAKRRRSPNGYARP
jgi:hypothetical protein